jgi:integrase
VTAPAESRTVRARLLELLMAEVRPEFRAEVFLPDKDSPVFYRGVCVVPACPVAVSHAARGLCEGHYQKWKTAQNATGVPFEEWMSTEDVRARDRIRRMTVVDACAVDGCNRAVKEHRLCHRHANQLATRGGRPRLAAFLTVVRYEPTATGERDCDFPDCGRWTDGPASRFCRVHQWRWCSRGKPALDDWLAELGRHGDPRVDFAGLGRQVKLEAQFGMQCRNDEGAKLTPPRVVTRAITAIRAAGVTSLLDLDDRGWRDRIKPDRNGRTELACRFIVDTRFRLAALLAGDDPWADQYPRDVWDLDLLRVDRNTNRDVRYFRFAGIRQPWLKELVKRWTRWRLARGLSISTLAINLRALELFAGHLPADIPPQRVDRERIEAWLAALQVSYPDPSSRGRLIRSLSVFLRDVHRNAWPPGLPPNALIFEDCPPRKAPRPRWIPERYMRQMEAPEAIAQFPSDDGRLVLRLLIACGLRLKDARCLPFECLSRDNDGAPYLVWVNYKMRRTAFFPIAEDLAAEIAAQQRRVLARFPAGCKWLFPGHQANLTGKRTISDQYWRNHFAIWMGTLRLVNEHGQPVSITAHQFRHTLGTRLINANVPQHVVQQLLDHMSPEMTAIYAKLHDQTVRQHWENAVKVNAEGTPVDLDPNHPLADAAWMRLSMVRAKVTLPNGYCGAPIQTDCEFANPCLDCRFFITSRDFLAQHRRQRDETVAFIDSAEKAGLSRVAEKNRRTLGKLDTIIGALETTVPGQVVAGGQVEDLDAAG